MEDGIEEKFRSLESEIQRLDNLVQVLNKKAESHQFSHDVLEVLQNGGGTHSL
jgi:hypothetical protein